MSVLDVAVIIAAGFAAGTINTIVGSGSLITFPTLLVLGYPPLTANVSNNIGLVPGGVSGSYGYRHELEGQSRTLVPARTALVRRLGRRRRPAARPARRRRSRRSCRSSSRSPWSSSSWVLGSSGGRLERSEDEAQPGWHRWALGVGIFVAGAYGGYFGAAQGVLLMGIFSALSSEPLQRLNAYKNVLSSIVNAVAAVTFVLFARGSIDWWVVLFIAVGSFVGGVVGARVGRRIPPAALRGLIVLIGTVAIVKLLAFP